MKISSDTLALLKNFASINSNLVVKPGSNLKTLFGGSSGPTIIVESTVAETFETEFCLFDLNKFLATVSLFKDPDFEFGTDSVTIKGQSGSSVVYRYSDPVLVKDLAASLSKKIKPLTADFEFDLLQKDFTDLLKASSVLQLGHLSIETNGDGVYLKLIDKKDDLCNTYSVRVGDSNGKDFRMFFKVENLKLLSGNYKVKISKNKVSEFVHQGMDLKYLVAMEHDSSWNS